MGLPLFYFMFNIPHDYDSRPPWAMTLRGGEPVALTPPCSKCGARRMAYRGPGYATGLPGGFWGEIIGAGSSGPAYMVSERVVDGLRSIGARGFATYPISITGIESAELQRHRMPRYYYFEITGGITIDWKASGLDEPCLVCGAPLRAQIRPPHRLMPVAGTWDGSDILRGHPYGGPFCSERVLQLAREQRWTNFRFYPLDATHDEITSSHGIEYLAP